MKRSFLLTTILLLWGVMSMQSQSLFVYKTDGSAQSFSLDELQDVTFTTTSLDVNKKNGAKVSFALDNLRYFTLKDDGLTGLIPVQNVVADVIVYVKNNDLVVKSAQPITTVNVLDLQGRKLLQLRPESQELSVSLAAYPAGVYLIQVADENGSVTKKIIKK